MDIIGYKEAFKDKRIYKKYITIDSNERDKTINSDNKDYSDPNDYVIDISKHNRFKNVITARIIEAMIPNSQYIINSNNKYIDVLYSGNIITTELTEGNYTTTTLQNEIKTQLEDIITTATITATITVLFNISNKKTSIQSNIDFTILFESGPNTDCNPSYVLGYENKDLDISSNEVIGDFAYHLNNTKYVDIQINEIPDLGNTLSIKNSNSKQILRRIPIDVDFGKEKFYISIDSIKNYNFFSPIELSKLTIKIFSDNGKIYDSNRIDNYLIIEFLMLQDEAPDNLGFHPKGNIINNPSLTNLNPLIENLSTNENVNDEPEENILNNEPEENILNNEPEENIIDNEAEENIIDGIENKDNYSLISEISKKPKKKKKKKKNISKNNNKINTDTIINTNDKKNTFHIINDNDSINLNLNIKELINLVEDNILIIAMIFVFLIFIILIRKKNN